MKYIAAYLLATLGGKATPSAADVEKILSSVGIEAESERVEKLISELKGKSLEELIESGKKKLSAVPTGGAAAPAAGGAAPAAAAAGAAPAKEEKRQRGRRCW